MDDPASISLGQVKRAAKEFLQKYHPKLTIPVPIEDIVELKLKIKTILIPGLIRNFGVNAFIANTFDSIVIDETMFKRQPERIRFTVAEEVGHLILHKNWYLKNGPKSFDTYLDWQLKLDKTLFNYLERQAKTFAGIILMPDDIFMEEWGKFRAKFNLPEQCTILDLPDTLPEFAQKFSVTGQCLIVRLNFLGLLKLPDGFWGKR